MATEPSKTVGEIFYKLEAASLTTLCASGEQQEADAVDAQSRETLTAIDVRLAVAEEIVELAKVYRLARQASRDAFESDLANYGKACDAACDAEQALFNAIDEVSL